MWGVGVVLTAVSTLLAITRLIGASDQAATLAWNSGGAFGFFLANRLLSLGTVGALIINFATLTVGIILSTPFLISDLFRVLGEWADRWRNPIEEEIEQDLEPLHSLQSEFSEPPVQLFDRVSLPPIRTVDEVDKPIKPVEPIESKYLPPLPDSPRKKKHEDNRIIGASHSSPMNPRRSKNMTPVSIPSKRQQARTTNCRLYRF